MANPEHLDILAKGVEAWNSWRVEHPLELIHLEGARLREANLSRFDLDGAYLGEADLAGANLTNASLLLADLRSACFERAVLDGVNLRSAKLCRARLEHARLRHADLDYADLSYADLTSSTLSDSSIRSANLREALASGLSADGADFSKSDLERADFRKAMLWGTIFDDSYVNGLDLGGAMLARTSFFNVDLSAVRGLDIVKHDGPSRVGIDSLYRSKGKVHESFLRGAGVPENFITYMKSLASSAFEFYSCFISYSTKDQAFAGRLYEGLQAQGVRTWFAPHDIRGGRKIHEQIDEAIQVYDTLLLILSEHSMSSNWVKTEIASARGREQQQKRQVLFPITIVPFDHIRTWKCFDADTGIDSAREIREYFIPDFSNWKDHDSYQLAFERLVRDLKMDR